MPKMSKTERWMTGPRPVDILDDPSAQPWRMINYRGRWTLVIRIGKNKCRRSTGYDATPENLHLAERRALTIFRNTMNDAETNEQGEAVDPRRSRRSGKMGWVYFIKQIGYSPIKIGWAVDVERRQAAMQAVNPFPLVLLGKIPGTIADERRWHDEFAEFRLHGEWFEQVDGLSNRIEQATKPHPRVGH